MAEATPAMRQATARWPGDDTVVVPRRRTGRWVAAAVVLLLAGMMLNSAARNPNFEWTVVGQYLFSPVILSGLGLTLWLTVVVMALGCVLGTLITLAQTSANPVLVGSATLYVWFFRGTPVLVQLIFWYNMAALYPEYAIGLPFMEPFLRGSVNSILTPLTAAILALGLNEAAYMAEIIRAGIQSVDEGQRDAARALGMRGTQALRRIILPQAMRAIIPPTGNQAISMLKGTSIVSIVALSDLLYSAQSVYSRTFQTIPLLLVASFWYLAATSVLSAVQSRIERHYGRSSRRDAGRPSWWRPSWRRRSGG